MAKQDYYALLGVAKDCSGEDLKRAYRKLAMQFHPDRNPGDHAAEAKFKDVSEAYDILKDDQKRAAYDRFGHAAFENGGGGAGAAGFDFGGGLGDIFDQMFGDFAGRRGQAKRGGADLRQGVEIELKDAFTGIKLPLKVATRVTCEACHGSGSENQAKPAETCGTCHGSGKVRAQQGFFLIERACPTCGGTGRVIRNPCRICHGAGTVQREKTLIVPIPAGIEDGNRIRLAGEGEAGPRGGPPGDLFVHVAIKPHSMFQREGATLLMRVPLRMSQAVLGDEVEVPLIDGGSTRVKIPPGTQTGEQFRLRGKGFSVLRSAARGDMYIQVAVETPQNLTRRQRELMEEFEQEAKSGAHPETEGFFAKLKDFLT
jgi:molecular chaperone DnaJ